MLNTGLNVNDIVAVSVNLSPVAAQERNFGSLLILGDSAVIDTAQRLRLYSSIAQVGEDFIVTAPEYLAAGIFFEQSPQPTQCYIGRWASSATSGVLQGDALTSAEQALANFTAITNGGVDFTIDGTAVPLTALNFSAAASLTAVASIITTALSTHGACAWNPNAGNFSVTSATTGSTSSVSFATPGTGTDISTLLGLSAAAGGYTVAGIPSETLASAVQTLDQMTSAWYGLQVASTVAPANSDYTAVATYIQAASNSHIFGVTTQDPNALIASSTTDLAYLLKAGAYSRTFCQYSSASDYASASIFGRAFTVDFNGQNTAITLMFKQEPGITAETLTESQAAALKAKNCNVFVNYNNATAILQNGVMASGQYFDVIHGTDWLQNAIQTAVYDLLYLSTTKVPQTDAGVNQIVATVAAQCDQAAQNGLIAKGTWNGPPIGAIVTGQTLAKGYYIYAPPVSSQTAAARAARTAPTIQAAVKLAGAVQSADVIVNVNQ